MFNRYFKADGNIDFVYANIAVKNTYFALISLDYILYQKDYNIGIYHDEHTYYFFHIQSLLTACGNISNIFYNTGFYNKNATQRSQRLRSMFGVSKKAYPLVFQKEVRNTNEHFDERYEQFNGNVGDYNLLDTDTPQDMRETILNNPHLRTYDKSSGIYYTYDRRLQQISYNLYDLRKELDKLRQAIIENKIYESTWAD